MKRQVYPTTQGNSDPDLLHVVYNARRLSKRGHAVTHIVRDRGNSTLCGISLHDIGASAYGSPWSYDLWSYNDDNLDIENIGCRRCRRSSRIKQLEEQTQ